MSSDSDNDLKYAHGILMGSVLAERGIYVIGFSFPVVPKGKARIRVQISAAHSFAEIDKCVAAFVEVGKQLGVID